MVILLGTPLRNHLNLNGPLCWTSYNMCWTVYKMYNGVRG